MTATRGQRRAPARWRGRARRAGGTAGLAAAVLLGVGPAQPVPPAVREPSPEPVSGTVVVHGRPGSFGALGDVLPSGQPLGQRAVPGWQPSPGGTPGPVAVAADGTVFGTAPGGSGGADGGSGSAITAYQPATGGFAPVPGWPAGRAVADLTPLAGGAAVAFTAGPAGSAGPGGSPGPGGPGGGPVLGILTDRDGSWQVATGDGWANQWTGGQLRASHPPLSEQACPEEPGGAAGRSECRGLGELVSLPHSGHLIVAQAGLPGWYNGQLLALRVAGPDRHGRFTVAVAGSYLYPNVRDPQTGEYLDLAFHALQADPTSGPGGERFVVGLRDPADRDADRPMVIQEFRYRAATGEITPISAPTIPGDQVEPGGRSYGYSAAGYDRYGNLWAARHRSIAGGPLAVYRGGLDCDHDPRRPPERYRTGAGDRAVWGQGCPPDYDLRQARELAMIASVVPDPVGGGVVALGLAGRLLPVRASVPGSGSGEELTFQVGNLVDTGLSLLPVAPGGAAPLHLTGGFDRHGRLWLPAGPVRPAGPAGQAGSAAAGAPADQWLYEVAVADLFDLVPVPLPEVPGQTTIVQAGHTVTTGTTQVAGAWAAFEVDSDAYLRTCTEGTSSVGCSYDGQPGDGFLLADHTGFGHLAGQVAYRVEVPVAGRYRVAYRVLTFEVTTDAAIVLSAGGGTHRTPVDTGGRWLTVPVADPVALPAGVHTIRLAPPEGHGGWYLNYLTLQRA